MLALLHIHFSFLCRSFRKNKKGEAPIILRAIYRDQRRDLYTGLYFPVDDWDNTSGRVKPKNKKAETLNKNLEVINYQALQVFDQLKYAKIPFTIDELVARLNGEEDRPILLVEYLKARNVELSKKAGVDFTSTSFEKYERTFRFVIHFLEKSLR